MRRPSSVLWMIRLYLAGTGAWLVWGWIEYAGPFKWAAEWQLGQFGYYGLKLTLLVPLLVLWTPALVVAQRMGVLDRVFGSMTSPAGGPRRRWAGRLAWLSLLPLTACVAAGAWYAAPHAPPMMGTLDLTTGDGTPPRADLVDVTGVVQRRYGLTVTETGSAGDGDSYVPLTGLHWTAREPVRYVLEHRAGAGQAMLEVDASGVVRVDRAELERDGLPGLVREGFRKDLTLADPVYVVRPGAEPGDDWLFVAVGAGFVAATLLLSAAILAVVEYIRGRSA